MAERRTRENSLGLRSLGFKRDDVRAAARLYGIGLREAAQFLIHSGLEGATIARQQTLRGSNRTDAAVITLVLNNREASQLAS